MKFWLPFFTAGFLAACGGDASPPPPSIKVYKSRGSVQCGGSGTPPEVMSLELTNAGVEVRSFACGSDGLDRPAVCGASDGRINIFAIPAPQVGIAASLSFPPLNTLSDAVEVPCT